MLLGKPAPVEHYPRAPGDVAYVGERIGFQQQQVGASADLDSLREHLATKFAKWQLPDAWAFIESVPRTSVGKFDKKVIRQNFADGALDVKRL